MFLRLTDLDGDLILIPLQQVKFIGVEPIKKKPCACVHMDDNSWLGGTFRIPVQETISEISLQLCHIETKSLCVRLKNGETENKDN